MADTARRRGGEVPVRRWAASGLVALLLVAGLLALDRRSLERANRLYRAGEVAAAADVYRSRVGEGAPQEPAPEESATPEAVAANPVASYGLGTSLLALGDPAAESHLRAAAASGESAVAQRAHYNLGYRFLGRAAGAPDPDSRFRALVAAVRHGRAAVELDPGDDDARWNLELARLRLEDLLRRAAGVDERGPGDPEDIRFDDGELVRAEASDSATRPPPIELPPSEEAGGPEDNRESPRVAVEGAEEALAGDDPGPLTSAAALELVRRGPDDPEHLIRRLLWVHRPDVEWWNAEPYPGGEW